METAIDNAKESCESGTTGECAAAWDEVISQPLLIHLPVLNTSSSAVYLVCRDALLPVNAKEFTIQFGTTISM